MKFLTRKKAKSGNSRRKQAKTSFHKRRWFQLGLQGSAISMILFALMLGSLKLNEKFSVTYWDIKADSHIKLQIDHYLATQQERDYWHTRASVMQHKLLLNIPDIQSLEVSRVLPDGLKVKAIARKPLALWKSSGERPQVMLIDEAGSAYRALKHGENLDLPILRLPQSELKQAVALLTQLQGMSANKLLSLSEVIVNQQQWHLNFAHGEQWKFSQASLQQDMIEVMNILDLPRWSGSHWRMDARIPQRWFIRPARQEVI